MTNRDKFNEVFSSYNGIEFCAYGEEVFVTVQTERENEERQYTQHINDWFAEPYINNV